MMKKSQGDNTYRVADKYRTNDLSLKDGGVTVCVLHFNGDTLEYDKIKYPSAFMRKINEDQKVDRCWVKKVNKTRNKN